MKAAFERFWLANCGATAIEYAMIAGGVALAIVAATTQLGTTLNGIYTGVLTALK